MNNPMNDPTNNPMEQSDEQSDGQSQGPAEVRIRPKVLQTHTNGVTKHKTVSNKRCLFAELAAETSGRKEKVRPIYHSMALPFRGEVKYRAS